MKIYLSIVLLLSIILNNPFKGNTQTLKVVENRQLSGVLTFLEEMNKFTNDNVSIKVYKIGMPSDTIPNSNSEEIYNRVFLSISEIGEFPKYKVYEISQLYDVGQFIFHSVDPFIERLEFVYGMYKQRKMAVFEINSKTLNVVRIQ
ncbi:MAG: hypothetical protein Q8K66_06440 [Sediminibacterium sp.]|nr:hypothetical protein [Sediminibacterium sp.]MDP3128225.1 hypothetical protein [Sediminibacterium sp.]